MSSKDARTIDRFMHLAIAIAASLEVVESANWRPKDEYARERTAVIVGSGIGRVLSIEENSIIAREQGAHRISPYSIPANLINLIFGYISIIYGYRDTNFRLISACSSDAYSIGKGMHMIKVNRTDVVLCSGSEAALSGIGVASFAVARALSTKYNDNPQAVSRYGIKHSMAL
jgi:3-oxoacyl-[acyl-carrier-protein] synthase II